MNSVRTTFLLVALTGLLLAIGAFFGGTKGMTVMFSGVFADKFC